jgi:PhnB protein
MLTPYLNIKGAPRAIEFYKQAFGAKERVRMPGPDGSVMHAELEIGDSVLMLSEALRDAESRSSIFCYVPDCDAVFASALAAGATTKMPLADQFWGDRFGSVIDPFGITWSIATHKEDVSPEEMRKRMAELQASGQMPGPPPSESPV